MEDEELMNLILEKLYQERYDEPIKSIRNTLNELDLYFRKNQLNRVMADIKNNNFAKVSKYDDDFEAQISPEGTVYCEDVLMLK